MIGKSFPKKTRVSDWVCDSPPLLQGEGGPGFPSPVGLMSAAVGRGRVDSAHAGCAHTLLAPDESCSDLFAGATKSERGGQIDSARSRRQHADGLHVTKT